MEKMAVDKLLTWKDLKHRFFLWPGKWGTHKILTSQLLGPIIRKKVISKLSDEFGWRVKWKPPPKIQISRPERNSERYNGPHLKLPIEGELALLTIYQRANYQNHIDVMMSQVLSHYYVRLLCITGMVPARVLANFRVTSHNWSNLHPSPLLPRKNQGKTIRCTVITSVGSSIDHPLPVQRELMEDVVTEMLKASDSW